MNGDDNLSGLSTQDVGVLLVAGLVTLTVICVAVALADVARWWAER